MERPDKNICCPSCGAHLIGLQIDRNAQKRAIRSLETKLKASEQQREELREALTAEHEARCGCFQPGDPFGCVAGQNFWPLTPAPQEEPKQ